MTDSLSITFNDETQGTIAVPTAAALPAFVTAVLAVTDEREAGDTYLMMANVNSSERPN
jgi:glycerol dehydrogenase-like iron-containing ADH family enzyme